MLFYVQNFTKGSALNGTSSPKHFFFWGTVSGISEYFMKYKISFLDLKIYFSSVPSPNFVLDFLSLFTLSSLLGQYQMVTNDRCNWKFRFGIFHFLVWNLKLSRILQVFAFGRKKLFKFDWEKIKVFVTMLFVTLGFSSRDAKSHGTHVPCRSLMYQLL